MHLQIKQSNVSGAGKGVFAYNPDSNIVFEKGDIVCEYGGSIISDKTFERRYSDSTAPYIFIIKKNKNIDSACNRSVGSMINHSSRSNVVWYVKKNKVYLQANKNIKHGSEIHVNYGKVYGMHEKGVSHKTIIRDC
jgi:hypothetical protein